MHYRPGDIGVPGGVGPRCAEGDLPAVGGAALDRQEGLCNIGPTGVPFDPRCPDDVLGLKHQCGFRLQAVVDLPGPRVEVVHQVEHTDAHASGIDANVLHIETLRELLDLGSLVSE